jgi:hypothetical protein
MRTAAALLTAAALVVAAAAAGESVAAAQADPRPAAAGSHVTTRPMCTRPLGLRRFRCLALVRTDVTWHAVAPGVTPDGYGPADLQSAYHLPSATTGAGQTVALIEAGDQIKLEADLATYRAQYGLPPCTTANGCFRKVNDQGQNSPLPPGDQDWGGETSLDVDMVAAVCPNCHILVVETGGSGGLSFDDAVNTAVRLGAKFVSNSYGGGENSDEINEDNAAFNHPGVVITASSGDDGYGLIIPAAYRHVVAAGGTTLNRGGGARGWTETAWDGAGSGCSQYLPKQSWQHDTGCPRRTVADVSAVADPGTGVAYYDSYGESGWGVAGGTSVSAPVIAAAYALAGTPPAGSYPAPFLYAHTSGLNDVTAGSNGSCTPAYLCHAGTGYDGPTGLGTPNGITAFGGSGGVPPPPPSANLALNRPASGSRSCNANETPDKAVNGSVSGGRSDKFCSTGANQYLQVDLGSVLPITRFTIRHAGAGGENPALDTRDYDLAVSADGATFTTVAQVRGNTADVTDTTVGTSGRFIRLAVVTPTGTADQNARIYEFEAYS